MKKILNAFLTYFSPRAAIADALDADTSRRTAGATLDAPLYLLAGGFATAFIGLMVHAKKHEFRRIDHSRDVGRTRARSKPLNPLLSGEPGLPPITASPAFPLLARSALPAPRGGTPEKEVIPENDAAGDAAEEDSLVARAHADAPSSCQSRVREAVLLRDERADDDKVRRRTR